MQNGVETTTELVTKIYDKSRSNISKYKNLVENRPLTLSEKILIGHMDNIDTITNLLNGITYVFLRPDRVALQDVTGQMTILQFMQSELKHVKIPTTVHCDHLIQARLDGKI